MNDTTHPIFGEIRTPTDFELAVIAKSVGETPLAVFQALNKAMNARGHCIAIETIPSQDSPQSPTIGDTPPRSTGLRRVILDAIQGVDPEEFEPQDVPGMQIGLGIIAEVCPGSTRFTWVPESLEALNTEMLMGIYDALRPGVLDALGKGE